MEDNAFAVSIVSIQVQEILLAASMHAVTDLERLIRDNEESLLAAGYDGPNVQDPDTGATPLHSAIRVCEDEEPDKADKESRGRDVAEVTEVITTTAEETVDWLLANGAQWNVLDNEGKTPGCRAWDLGERGRKMYDRLVREAMIRELIVGKLERMQEAGNWLGEAGYVELASEDEDGMSLPENEIGQDFSNERFEESAANEVGTADRMESVIATKSVKTSSMQEDGLDGEPSGNIDQTDDGSKLVELEELESDNLTNAKYLSTPLTSTENALIDAHHNGVMMSWERHIMHRSASALLTVPGLRLLNIGFGMGIFDTFAQERDNRPSEHHIIEAHPDVLKRLRAESWYERPGVTIHEGTWQEVCSTLSTNETRFNAIFYDTFAESYSAFRDFFMDAAPKLLVRDESSRWSFFNGMGADRQICYDVYQKVVDCELDEAGWTAEFEELEVPHEVLDDEKEWEGVRRKYWTVKSYRVPTVRFKEITETANSISLAG